MQPKPNNLKEDLAQLELEVSGSLQAATEELAGGLPTLDSPTVGRKETAAGSHKLVWRWQDRVAQVLEDYVTGLWEITEQHQIHSAWDWIENRVRNTFQLMLKKPELPHLGLLDWKELPSIGGQDIDEGNLAGRAPAPVRTEWLGGDLLLVHEGCQLRIPVTVSAQLRFREARTLRLVEIRVRKDTQVQSSALEVPGHSHWVFKKQRFGWSIGFADRPSEFPDFLGMTYLQTLLRDPDKGISVEALVALARPEPVAAPILEDPATGNLGDPPRGQEILDARTRQQYRNRIAELKKDAYIAQEVHDDRRLADIHEELEQIEDQIRRNTALRGRQRGFATVSDKQRVSVRKATMKAMSVISQRIPEIGEHLHASITFGFKCSYRN